MTETVFSMDGDVAPLDAIVALAEKYGASVIVDEAHATAVHGPRWTRNRCAIPGRRPNAGCHAYLRQSFGKRWRICLWNGRAPRAFDQSRAHIYF